MYISEGIGISVVMCKVVLGAVKSCCLSGDFDELEL